MSNLPPPNPGETVNYASQGQRTNGLALTSMILGIVAIPATFCCSFIGIPVGIAALVMGIIGLRQVNFSPQRFTGKGMAIAGIVTGSIPILLFPLLLAVLLPSLGRARELSNRTYCAANARGLMQSMNVYGADNSDTFPLLPYAPYGSSNNGVSSATIPGPNVEDGIKSLYASATPVQAGSPLASTWVLVLKNMVTPKQFVCKSDPFAGTASASLQPAGSSDYYINFQMANQISYSFAYPYDKDGKPNLAGKAMMDSSLPVMADMSPLNGTGSPTHNVSPGALPGNPKTWNSANHQSEGQTVGWSDGHASFERRPDVGQSNDNIYSTSGTTGVTDFGGTQPTTSPIIIQTESSPFDVYMVPARNLTTGGLN